MQQIMTDGQKKSIKNMEEEFYADTMEEETKKETSEAMNREMGIFGHAFADGLNREQGIFDKTALFKTK